MSIPNSIVVPVKNIKPLVKRETRRDSRGRPSFFESKKSVAAVLRGEVKVTRFHMVQLVEDGYLEAVTLDKVKPGRGRRPLGYQLTSKGKGLVALSRNWFGKDKTVTVHEASDDAIATASEIIEGDDNVTEDQVIENVAEAIEARADMAAILEAESVTDGDQDHVMVSEGAENDASPDPANDDDFEIPAFLRRNG